MAAINACAQTCPPKRWNRGWSSSRTGARNRSRSIRSSDSISTNDARLTAGHAIQLGDQRRLADATRVEAALDRLPHRHQAGVGVAAVEEAAIRTVIGRAPGHD